MQRSRPLVLRAGLRCSVERLDSHTTGGGFSSFFAYPTENDPVRDTLAFLGDAVDQDWDRLLAHTEHLRLAPGDVLVRAGDVDRTLYVVASGRLDVILPSTGATAGTIEARSVAGELGFVDGLPRSATIRALTDVDVFALRYDAFETLSARHPALARRILIDLARILATRLRRATEALDRPGGGR